MTANVLVVNGFDRSGTSLIAGLLAHHEQVSYLCQPFSGGELHHSQYEIWPPDHSAPELLRFFSFLSRGVIDKHYIRSGWHQRHSRIRPNGSTRLYLIKETKLHCKLPWFRRQLPDVDVVGIWRDPRAILYSLMRNGFHRSWYGDDAFDAIRRLVSLTPDLRHFSGLVEEGLDEVDRMAVVIAVRTHVMAVSLNPAAWLEYEQVILSPSETLAPLLARYDLQVPALEPLLERNYNLIGEPPVGPRAWQDYFSADQRRRLDYIFEHIAYVPRAA